jgi:amidase
MRVSTFRDDALGDHDAVSLQQALAAGQVSPQEVRQAARERAEQAHLLNAVVTWLDDQPGGTGPFAGIPTFIKDNEDIAGYPTSFGSRATPTSAMDHDSRLVRDWRQLGFATLGKSALPEFGLTATTESIAHGATRNPWGLDHSTGGSSGGSAALVAAGVVPIAHANDGGGSIRIPASCCGLVGLKPSRGRLVDVEAMDQLPVKLVTQGVVTRTVRDTVAFYQAMARVHSIGELPPIGPTSDPRPLRIGMITAGIGGLQVDPEVRQAVHDAGKACEALGHTVEPMDNPFGDQIAQDFLRYWGMLAFSLQRLGGQMFGKDYQPQLLEPFTIHLSKFFSSVAVGLPGSIRRLRKFAAAYDEAFRGYDLLLSPVLASPPVRIGYLGPEVDAREHLIRVIRYASFTEFQNVSGAPAISVPLSMSSTGLPMGMHFAARTGQDQLLLDLAASLEQSVGWRHLGQA